MHFRSCSFSVPRVVCTSHAACLHIQTLFKQQSVRQLGYYTFFINIWEKKAKTRWLYCVECHNTVFGSSGPLSVHKLFTSCIRRFLVSRACDWVMSTLSAVLFIFSFQFSLLFFHIGRHAAQRRTWFTQSDIGCCRKFGKCVFVRRVPPRWMILNRF